MECTKQQRKPKFQLNCLVEVLIHLFTSQTSFALLCACVSLTIELYMSQERAFKAFESCEYPELPSSCTQSWVAVSWQFHFIIQSDNYFVTLTREFHTKLSSSLCYFSLCCCCCCCHFTHFPFNLLSAPLYSCSLVSTFANIV